MHESMLWTNASGCIVAAGLGLLTGQLAEGIAFCTRHPEVPVHHHRRHRVIVIIIIVTIVIIIVVVVVIISSYHHHDDEFPHQVLRAVLLYSISSAVGQNFIYYTITQFNPLVLTTVTPEMHPRCARDAPEMHARRVPHRHDPVHVAGDDDAQDLLDRLFRAAQPRQLARHDAMGRMRVRLRGPRR